MIGDKLAERAAEPVDDDKRNDSSLANADASNVDDSQGHIESEPSRVLYLNLNVVIQLN